jgi:ABC-type lipoprotein release transport system permease subunit
VRATNDIPSPAPEATRKLLTGLQEVAHYIPYPARISIPVSGKPARVFKNVLTSRQVSSIAAEPSYFNIFKYDWLAGNASCLNRPFQLVLTESKARLYFGTTASDKIIGRQVVFNDSLQLTVSGIVKDWNANTDFPFTEFISLSSIKSPSSWGNGRDPSGSSALVKLEPGSSPERIGRELSALAISSMKIDSGTTYSLQLQPLAEIHFDTHIDDGIRKANLPTLYGLTAIAYFILLIACINFINLSTALSLQRAKEIGIRKVLGSNKANLVFQFLAETLILTSFALTLALLLVQPVLAGFHSFLPDGLRFHFFSPATLLFVLLLLPGTALLAGLYPATVLSAYEPAVILKGGGLQKGGQKGYLRKGLIVFQFTISLLFIIGTLVVRDQINYIRNKDLGFVSNAVVSIDTDWSDSVRKVGVLAQKIKQLEGVDQVALQSFPPLTPIGTGLTITYDGKARVELPATIQSADEHFIPLYRMKLLAGRNLIHSDSLREYIINETCAKGLGFADPGEAIGKIIDCAGAHPITGVVADFHEKSLREPIKPIVFLNMPVSERNIAVKLAATPGQAEKVLGKIEKQWKSVYPGKPFVYSFLDESIASMYKQERKTATLMSTAMIVTIFISCMGLLGLSLFSAAQRTREIGIRKVLGATVTNILVLLSKEFVFLVVIAFTIAVPIAWYFMNEWLQNFAYRIVIPWWLFGLAGAGSVLIALLTVSLQSFKAALANPVKILKSE